MTDISAKESKTKINKIKIYTAAIGSFLVVNFAVETAVTFLENSTQQWLYPIFPFTRIGLLILTILTANHYIRRRMSKPKPKLWWRIVKSILLMLIAYGLIMGAWLSVSQADASRAVREAEKSRQSLSIPPKSPKTEIGTNYEANR